MLKINSEKLELELHMIGSDPEAMIIDNNKNEIISAIGYLPGQKNNTVSIGNNCEIQTDNVLAEWCVPPTDEPENLYESIKYCINRTNGMLPQNHEVIVKSSHIFDDKFLQDDQAKEFGCEPDLNAYTGEFNGKPNTNTNLRTAGGHLHFSYTHINKEKDNDTYISTYLYPEYSNNLIKFLDAYLGLPSILLDPDDQRRQLYGKAGSYRNKAYGIEYRTLSNFWIDNLELIRWIFSNSIIAFEQYSQYIIHGKHEIIDSEMSNLIMVAINTNDKKLTQSLINSLNIPMPIEVLAIK